MKPNIETTVDAGDSPAPIGELRLALGQDLSALAILHDRELDVDTIALLKAAPDEPLGLQLEMISGRGKEAVTLFAEAVKQLPARPGDELIDELAADYAGIYLTHALRASPCESVWLDEDGLAMQEPMFQIRDWYQRHGLQVRDWRTRSDDHLVLQLQFLAHMISHDVALDEAARFLDEHLLRWIDHFAARVASRCATAFYASLSAVTAAYLDELRDLLSELLDQPRPKAGEIEARMKPVRATALPDPQFVPGASPSW